MLKYPNKHYVYYYVSITMFKSCPSSATHSWSQLYYSPLMARVSTLIQPPFLWKCLYQVRFITVFTVFRLLTDFVCLYTYKFWLSLWKIVRRSLILLLPLLTMNADIQFLFCLMYMCVCVCVCVCVLLGGILLCFDRHALLVAILNELTFPGLVRTCP